LKKTILYEILTMILIGISLSALTIPHVNALPDGTLYINPPALANQAAGTTLQYQVKVFNMPTFNTWDIQVAVDPTILNPTAIDTTVNTLTANFSVTVLPLTSCINGAGKACDPAAGDGPGVVHSAILPLGSPDPGSVITGVLFTITYSVVNPGGATGATTVHFGPTAPALANAGVPVAVSAINDGSYGAPPSPTTTGVSCDSPIIVSQGSTCTATLTDTSGTPTTPNGMVSFTGTGNITPLTASCTLSAGITAGTSTCTANFSGTATGTASVVGQYGGDFTHSSSTSSPSTIIVNPRPTTTTVSCGPSSIGTGQA